MHDIVRWNEKALEKALKTRRVVVISGARQCGKSTLLGMYFRGKAEVRSLDSKQFRDAALLDPQSFIRNDTDCPTYVEGQSGQGAEVHGHRPLRRQPYAFVR